MDMNSMMQNPMAQQMMSSVMSDPELMQLIQRPGMAEKLSALMQNPATAMQYAGDPDVQLLMSKVQALQGGGGAGARSGGAASATSSSAGAGAAIVSIHSKAQFDAAIAAAADKLVAVDFTASWCGPCKIIAPVFAELASTYHATVVFLKVDGDENRDWIVEHNVTAFPTFHFFVKGNKIASFSGADQNRLRSIVEQYGSASEEAPPCPYVHFPLKDTEIVKYADIEWNPVESKLAEYNTKLYSQISSASSALDEKENAELNVILQKLQNRSSYHQSSFTTAQYAVVNKLLQWPVEYIGPVLNFFRLLILHPHAALTYSKLVTEKKTGTIDGVSQLLVIAKNTDKHVIALLAIRCLCNFFSRHVSQLSMGARTEDIIDILAPLFKRFAANQSVRASVIALIINYAILFTKDPTFYAAGKVQVLSSLTEILTENPDLDAVMLYRLYVVMGTLVYGDESTREMATDMELPATVTASAKKFMTDEKVSAVVRELNMAMLKEEKK